MGAAAGAAADGRAMREALRASGDGVIPFAQRHGLHEERVRRWVRRLEGMRPTRAAPVPPPGFAPVRLVEPSAEGPGLEVAVGGRSCACGGASTRPCCGTWWPRSEVAHADLATRGPRLHRDRAVRSSQAVRRDRAPGRADPAVGAAQRAPLRRVQPPRRSGPHPVLGPERILLGREAAGARPVPAPPVRGRQAAG
jgi:hypothetical protein